NEEVRAMTLKSGLCTRWSISSSDSPSEKYSWSCFSLISTNGRTAIDLSRWGWAGAGEIGEALVVTAAGTACGGRVSAKVSPAAARTAAAATARPKEGCFICLPQQQATSSGHWR